MNEKEFSEYLNYIFLYDAKNGCLVRKIVVARNTKIGDIVGLKNKNGYIQLKIKRKIYLAHRIIWLMNHCKFPDGEIDHIDGNRSNNCLENLRDVTKRENLQNKTIHRTGRLPGATYKKANKKWVAQIEVNGKRKHIGYFFTEIDAHIAYKEAIKRAA